MDTQDNRVMEKVSASLSTYQPPEQYDPIVRQEPAREPTQYTHMTPEHYQHLSRVLTQARSSLAPQIPGGFISPPPSKQTEEIIRFLIDLFESQKKVQEYRSLPFFANPRDWMFLISTDVPASRIQQQRFVDVLPINEVQKLIAQGLPHQPIDLPERQPDPRYRLVDRLSQLYNVKTANVPVPQLVEPLYRVLDWQAQQELQLEKFRNQIRKGLTVLAPSQLLARRGRCSNESHVLWLPDNEGIDEEFLFERYQMLLEA